MLLFWSLAVLLLAVTLALLLPPLVRRHRPTATPDFDTATIAVYRDQKRALDSDLASGTMAPAERDAAVLELSRRLGEEIGTEKRANASQPRRAWPMAIALLALIPLAAVLLYLRLGSPDATTLAAAGSERAAHEMSDPQILAMVEQLAQRMKSRPDDPQGWILLARSYAAMGRFTESVDAYSHAAAFIPDDAALLADYADVLAMSQGKVLAGKPAELISRALAIDPKNPKALALAATAALDARDLDGAIGYWRRLRAQFAEGSDEARQIGAIIAEIEAERGAGKGSGTSGKLVARAERQPAASGPASVAGSATIAGRVDIAPSLASKVTLTDTVFIFARAIDGSRMPLAVLRLPARELPKEFTLDDSMSMAPTAKLSSAQAVIIEARVSKSGNALPQSGDLAGKSAAVKPGASGVKIVIDQVVP
jgi:cytochrome c-type biogenesis protein CcmH